MKKRVIVFLMAITVLLLAACTKVSVGETIEIYGNPVTEAQIRQGASKELTVLDWKPLTVGGALVACKAADSGDDIRFFLYYTDGEKAYSRETYRIFDEPYVKIFYDADWQGKIKEYNSQYIVIEANGQKDVLIFVMQNYDHEHETAYVDSPMYGIEPSDTPGTVPMTVHDPNWFRDYPMWVFEVPMEDIDETYALTYGEWVLTAEDILNHTWQNGDAPIMK